MTNLSENLLTPDQIASIPNSFFVSKGEGLFEELLQTPIHGLVEMYQGEPIDDSSQPCFLYDGVGNLGKKEGLDSRRFLSLPQGTDANRFVLDRSSNSQIVVTDEESEVYRVDFWQYWSGNLFDYNGLYDEINGVEADGLDDVRTAEKGYFSTEALNEILSNAGIEKKVYAEIVNGLVTHEDGRISNISTVSFWSAEEKAILTTGEYEGTSWQEGNIYFDTPYYVVFPDAVLTPAPTKLGYFACDFTLLEQGLYILMNGENTGGQIIEVV